jgi:hypothetical protein
MEPEPVEMEPTPTVEEIKDECKSCQKKIEHNCSLINTRAFHCRWCDGWEEDDTSDDETSEGSKKTSFYCRFCTRKCWNCKVRGCEDCVDVVCCDCCVRMCSDCRNSDVLCGCYGECCCCGRDINRGSDGWPCNDCNKWYCGSCRYDDNDCQECNPRSDETSEGSEEEEEETPYINVEEKVEKKVEEKVEEKVKEKVEEKVNEPLSDKITTLFNFP